MSLVSSFHAQFGRKIVSWQLFLTILTATVLLPAFGLVTAYSALAGGMISVVANTFFALKFFSDKEGWQPDEMAAMFYRGVIVRIVLTIAMFVAAMLLLKPVNIIALFAVYLWIQVSPALIAGVQKRV